MVNGDVGKLVTPVDCKSAASGTVGSTPTVSTKNAHRRFTVWQDGLCIPGYQASQTATRVLAKEHSNNLGSKVFTDARMPVTHKEGDRYPLRPPSYAPVA